MQAIPKLVKLFNHSNQEVQRHATGAMRNLIYDSPDNKMTLVEENGIYELLAALKEQDDELRKNVTGMHCALFFVFFRPLHRMYALQHLFVLYCIFHFSLKYWKAEYSKCLKLYKSCK